MDYAGMNPAVERAESIVSSVNRQFLESHDPAIDALLDTPAEQPVALLHSGRSDAKWASASHIGRPTSWFRFTADRQAVLTGPDCPKLPFAGRPFRDLRTLLNCPDLPGPWIGYLSYDLARLIEPTKLAPPASSGWPLIELAHCPNLQSIPSPSTISPVTSAASGGESSGSLGPSLPSNFTRSQYEAAVQRALDYIAAGDAFQVNLAQRFATDYTGDPRKLFARLNAISPAWYGAYLDLPAAPDLNLSQRALLSTSPELFLKLENNHVTTRPIKGTRPNPQSHRDELLRSEKDTAELHMIVDLMRNDLGRVCRYGSVRVTEPRSIESHPTVHHGVATVEGDLHESRDAVDLLKAAFPGGSVTGAPKVRAMQIIDELEPTPRGPYCGAIGLISKDSLHLNIAIRTIALEHTLRLSPGVQRSEPRGSLAHWSATFHAGGGIVADSTPADEYDETLTKATAMAAALSTSAPPLDA